VPKEVHNILAFYDIRNEKRLNRVAKVMEDYGERVLKSVFECTISRENFEAMWARIEKIIDKTTDSVIYYFLCDRCASKVEAFGKKVGFKNPPEGSMLV
jgi:CRISPR-associated protein Cas2